MNTESKKLLDMKVTPPFIMLKATYEIKQAIKKFEEELYTSPRGRTYYLLIVREWYNKEILSYIAEEYLRAGWSKAEFSFIPKGEKGYPLTSLYLEI